MYCRHCGNQILDDSAFCNSCGKSQENKPKNRYQWFIPTTVALGLFFIFVICWTFWAPEPQTIAKASPTPVSPAKSASIAASPVQGAAAATATSRVIIQPQTRVGDVATPVPNRPAPSPTPTTRWVKRNTTLASINIEIPPGQVAWYPVNVPIECRNPNMQGVFRASGGSGNDVMAWVIPAAELENFKNSHGFRTFYTSGKITTDTFSLYLPTGYYFFALSNRFSAFSKKKVGGFVTLTCEVPEGLFQ